MCDKPWGEKKSCMSSILSWHWPPADLIHYSEKKLPQWLQTWVTVVAMVLTDSFVNKVVKNEDPKSHPNHTFF